jgi:hypothetical protein
MIYTIEEKKSLISELILMDYSDNNLMPAKIAFINSGGKRMDKNEFEINRVINHPGALEVKTPKNFTNRMIHLQGLMLTIDIGGNVDDK